MQTRPVVAEAVPSPAQPQLGGRYEVRAFAGAGSFGDVWKIYDTWRRQDRAAKFLCPSLGALDWKDRFYREYSLLYKLRHPGLVSAHEYGNTEDGTPFFTMDWIPGPTLEDHRWTADQRLRIVWELLDTIGFMHREDIIHADIKLANIKVDIDALEQPLGNGATRALRLLDFGLTVDAKIQAEESRRGTVHYMAPEWFKPGDVDFRIDLYSLGVLLFELFANRLPFDGNDPLLVIRQHLESPPPILSEINADTPQPISEAVERLLAKQPEVRDKGWNILAEYVAGHFGVDPNGGEEAIVHHAESLGAYGKLIAAEVIDSWLGHEHAPRVLYIRGGTGLDQDYVLRSLVPEICHYGYTPWLVDNLDEPLPPHTHTLSPEQRPIPLMAIAPDQANRCQKIMRRWAASPSGVQRAAVSLAADDPRNHSLAMNLATQVRQDIAILLPVGCIDDLAASRRLDTFLGAHYAPEAEHTILRKAAGNPARLLALASDSLADRQPDDPDSRHTQTAAAHFDVIRDGFQPEERTAMTLIAVARDEVDRETLRALADTSWEKALSQWLDLGLAETHDSKFRWIRPDWQDLLLQSLPRERQQIVHRAWAEYWASQKPEPGDPGHEHLVFHLLRSDAHRQAVRAGLENAAYWTGKHEAKKALEILHDVSTSLKSATGLPPSLMFKLVIEYAEARRVLARYNEALTDLQEALKHEAIAGHARREAEVYKRIGDLHKSLKQPGESQAALHEALQRYRSINDDIETARVLNNLGNTAYLSGELDSALRHYEEALGFQRKLQLPHDMATVLNNIGGVQLLRSHYEDGQRALLEAVEIQRRLDAPEGLALSLNNLGVIYVETGKFRMADEVLKESYRINTKTGKTGGQLFNLENLAVVAMARGEWAQAMANCETGLKLCDASDEQKSRPPFLLVIAGVALAHGNYDLIVPPLREATQILKRIEDPDLTLQKVIFTAEHALWRNSLNEAEKTARSAAEMAAREDLPTWQTKGLIMAARAIIHSNADAETARPLLVQTLQIAERIGALPEQITSRVLLAELEIAQGQLDTAGEHLRKCEGMLLECSAKPLFLHFSRALGRFYERRGDLPLALSIFDTARKLAKNLTCMEWMWRLHGDCGHNLLHQKDYQGAVDQYRSALVILEHIAPKLAAGEQERYMNGKEKIALAEGLRICHKAVVRQKK